MTFRFSAPQQPGSFTFGPGGLGVRGDALAQTGTHGRGILADDVALPAEAGDEFAYRITTMPPLLTLFRWFDDGGVEAEGPVGVHTGVAEARKNGVVYGSAPFNVVIGGGVLSGGLTLDDAAPSGTLGQAAPSVLSGGITTDSAQPSGVLSTTQPSVLGGGITLDGAVAQGQLASGMLVISGQAVVGPVVLLGNLEAAVAPSFSITGPAVVAPVQLRGSISGYLSTPEPLSGPAYATAQAYIERFGIDEATGMLADEERLLTATLLRDAVAGVFSGTPSAAQVQAARAAAARLRRQLATVSNFMDGYLRSAVVLPMAAGDANAGTLEECCLHLARFGLADDTDNATDRMDTTAKMWREWLRDVSAGKVQLVGVTGQAAPSQGRVRRGRTKSAWDWGGYGNGGGGMP